ncbi:MAG: ABC transporter ATP-binding protein [Clostridia bacterium]|nr:ABC transporter ATP-binding protein [Clostridia bacterium]
MKKLWIYLKAYRKESILAPLFKLLESLMDLLVPIVVADIINRGIGGNDRGLIVRYFLLLIGLALLGIGFSFVAQWMAAKASVGFASRLRQALFDHIQQLSYRELDSLGTDTMITRMTSDVNQVQNGLNLALRLLLRSPFIVFGAMIMAFTIDVRSAVIFAVVIPLLSLVVFGIMLMSIPLFAKVQAALDRLLGMTRENLTGVRVIRAFCKEKQEIDEFDRRNTLLTKLNEKVGRLSALMNPATFLMINFATIILIRTGALRVESGAILQGDVVALYNYMAMIVVELVKLASLIISINKALACGRRVQAMLETAPSMQYPDSMPETPEDTGMAVRFDHVSFAYAGAGDEALTDIDFSVRKGQTVGIIGGTGSGKTTVAQLISRFYDASSGCVKVNGLDVRQYPAGALTDRIGVVPQKAVLFQGTIRDNLKWGNENATDEELWEALETAQGTEVVRGKDGQLDAPVEQGGRNFSGGQRQRLTIARALVKKPEILILDDSASALDFATDLALRRAIANLLGSMTVFIISQRTSSVRSADRVLVLDDGRMAGFGTHDELMRDCEAYQEIYYSQFPEERNGTGVTA